MMANFGNYSLLGEVNTIYYNVHHRRYITNPNTIHASLFQTAFRYDAIPALYESLSAKFIDCVLWQKVANKHLFYEHSLSVGIKGLPGRAGIGAGHSRAMNMKADLNLNYLRALIGDDAQHYAGHYGGGGNTQHGLFVTKRL
jgi:superoxide dismutase